MNFKTAIVTGAAGNLGKSVTQGLLAADYHVNALISPNDNPMFNADKEVETHSFDLTDETASRRVLEDIVGERGSIDLVVMIAGGYTKGDLRTTFQSDLLQMYQLNFATAYNIAKPSFQQMEKQSSGGQLIFIGSRSAINPVEGKDEIAYALSKSLLFRLAEIINEEGTGKKITATVLVPSIIDTPGNRNARPEMDFSQWVTPNEIAENVLFITSQAGMKLRQSILKIYNNV